MNQRDLLIRCLGLSLLLLPTLALSRSLDPVEARCIDDRPGDSALEENLLCLGSLLGGDDRAASEMRSCALHRRSFSSSPALEAWRAPLAAQHVWGTQSPLVDADRDLMICLGSESNALGSAWNPRACLDLWLEAQTEVRERMRLLTEGDSCLRGLQIPREFLKGGTRYLLEMDVIEDGSVRPLVQVGFSTHVDRH